jgi:hypothetical protein
MNRVPVLIAVFLVTAAVCPLAFSDGLLASTPAIATFKECNSTELGHVTCEAPGRCLNACARHCLTQLSARQCCVAFSSDPEAYETCRRRVAEVWNEGDQPIHPAPPGEHGDD